MTGWIQPSDVARLFAFTPSTTNDDERLRLVCDGLNQLVRELRPDIPLPVVTGAFAPDFSPAFDSHENVEVHDWNPRITLGLCQLARDWYTGLGDSPAQYDGMLPPPAVTRAVELLLEINRSFRPVVA